MNVELPNTGCNIINSSTNFYNYSNDNLTRKTYIIYEGKAILQSSTYNQYGYTHTGNCLSTGDLVYKPELGIYFPIFAFGLIFSAMFLAYKIVLGRFIR